MKKEKHTKNETFTHSEKDDAHLEDKYILIEIYQAILFEKKINFT